MEFDVHASVEDAICFGAEDEGVRRSLEVNDLFVFVELIMGLSEGGELQITHDQRVGTCTKDSSVVDSSAVNASIVQED